MNPFLSILISALSSCSPPSCYTVTSTTCVGELCDITAPLKAAIATCEQPDHIFDDDINNGRTGCRIEIPAGRYVLTETIEMCRGHHITGDIGRFWNANTRLEMPGGVTGFHLRWFDECQAEGKGGGAGGAVLEDFALISTLGTSTTTPSYGVWVEAERVTIQRMWIRSFVQGIRISAGVHRVPRTNANLPAIKDVRVDVNEHIGIYLQGSDVNAGYSLGADVSANCWFWERWASAWDHESEPPTGCAQIYNSAFLNHTDIAAHTASCWDRETGADCHGFVQEGTTQRALNLGLYSENDQLDNRLAPFGIAIGGLSMWDGNGGWMLGNQMRRLTIINDLDPAKRMQVELGNISGIPGVGFQLRSWATKSGWPLALRSSDKYPGWWVMTLANSEAWPVLHIAGDQNLLHTGTSTTVPLGTLELAPKHNQLILNDEWLP